MQIQNTKATFHHIVVVCPLYTDRRRAAKPPKEKLWLITKAKLSHLLNETEAAKLILEYILSTGLHREYRYAVEIGRAAHYNKEATNPQNDNA